ncbi:MAG TPA: Gfo/Idh/MocA family oxidoreductase [Longimicrobiales bacterium]|nr:Gfo/Idh/MocA family oxidoreductase [Longimicrobiales bacterium]
MTRHRIGIVGCGVVARTVHVPLLRTRTDIQVRALVDPDPVARAEAARSFPGAAVYDDVESAVEGAELDAVVITAPTAVHAPITIACLNRGWDVYVEKPLASTLREANEVLRAWQASGRMGVMGFNARFHPLMRRLKDRLGEGRAGPPVQVRTVFTTAPRELPPWKRQRATGGGALLDLGAHHIDLVRYLFGLRIVAARAAVDSRRTEHDTAALEMVLEGGLRVLGHYSLAAAEREAVEVHGEEARLVVSRFTSLDVTITGNPGRDPLLARLGRGVAALTRLGAALRYRRAPFRDPGYALVLGRFIAAVGTREMSPDTPDLRDGWECLAVIDAAERSLRSGRLESVDLGPGFGKPGAPGFGTGG